MKNFIIISLFCILLRTSCFAVSSTIEVSNNGMLTLNTGTPYPYVTGQNSAQQLIQHGFAAGTGVATIDVTYPVAFSTSPHVTISGLYNANSYSNVLGRLHLYNVTATGFRVWFSGNVTSPQGIHWIAIGDK